METYYGHVRTPADASILFEACCIGLLPRAQRRLSKKERQTIRSGSTFVWDERETGIRRWTDDRSWSASRISGGFLTCREMEGRRAGGSVPRASISRADKTPDITWGNYENAGDNKDKKDEYLYKPDGLLKQSISITTSTGQRLHLINYYSCSHPYATNLQQPTTDPALQHVHPLNKLYYKSAVNCRQSLPVASSAPMAGATGNLVPHPGPSHARTSQAPSYTPPSYALPPNPLATPSTAAFSPYDPPSDPPDSRNDSFGPFVTPSYGHQDPTTSPSASHPHTIPPPPHHDVPHERPHPESTRLPPRPLAAALPPPYYPGHSPHSIHKVPPQQRSRRAYVQFATVPCLASLWLLRAAGTPVNEDARRNAHLLKRTLLSAPQLFSPFDTTLKPLESGNTVSPIGPLVSGVSLPPIMSSVAPSGVSGIPLVAPPSTIAQGPRDIPNHKIVFVGEDMRVLRLLDRVFI